MFSQFFVFSAPDAAKNLLKYKYKPENESIFEKFYLTACYEFVANYLLPSSVAPNMVTVTGNSIYLFGFMLIYLNSNYFTTTCEPYSLNIIYAICLFIYQMLDGADGIHARNVRSPVFVWVLFFWFGFFIFLIMERTHKL